MFRSCLSYCSLHILLMLVNHLLVVCVFQDILAYSNSRMYVCHVEKLRIILD